MTKRINFFLLLAIIAAFTACNNANKPMETAKEISQRTQEIDDTQDRNSSAKSLAQSERRDRNETGKSMNEKSGGAENIVQENTNESVTDENGKKIRAVPSAPTPQTDADRLRQMNANNGRRATNASNNRTTQSGTPTQPKMKTVQNSKVKSPTVTTPTTSAPAEEEEIGAPNHEDWNALLTQYVSNSGKVNYKGLRGAQGKLNGYLDVLKNNPPASDWTRNEKMAYWINAYNAFTVKKILDNYPLSSIQNLSGGKVWDDKWINIGSETYSLNDIENGILRPKYKDARIHFAVNCAAKSCPSLHNRAFTADNLERTLAQQTKKFVNNSDFNTISANKVTVSKIFDWYSSDFGDLKEFLNKYADMKINADAAVDYMEYDWSLNE